jgi:hypothetical protein
VLLVTWLSVAVLACCFRPVDGAAGGNADADSPPGEDASASPASDGGSVPDAQATAADAGGTPERDAGQPDGGASAGKLGDPCVREADCRPGFCLTEALGFGGGTCSDSCKVGGSKDPCGPGTTCLDYTAPSGQRRGVCLKTCAVDSECRTGYVCEPVGGSPDKGCLPGSRGKSVGDPCKGRGDCAPGAGFCIDETRWGYPAGYCSVYCDTVKPGSCPPGSFCQDYDPNDRHSFGVCLKRCGADSECRSQGYTCDTAYFGMRLPEKGCIPGTRKATPVGTACANQSECEVGMLCAAEQWGFPGGYCTRHCDTSAECQGDGVCLFADPGKPKSGFCLDGCGNDADCRAGGRYACTARLYGTSIVPSKVCAPFQPKAAIGATCESIADCPIGGYCIPEIGQDGRSTGFKGGYCSDACETAPSDSCPKGSFCQDFGRNGSYCLVSCAQASECRTTEGYKCKSPVPQGAQKGCWPF